MVTCACDHEDESDTLLLLRVSGVAMLERTLKESKPGYEEYISKINAFFLSFPR